MDSAHWTGLAKLGMYHWCGAASAALLFYDYTLTLPREVRCIWTRSFSGATLLFLVNRYFTMLVVALNICSLALSGSSVSSNRPAHEVCFVLSRINQAMSVVFALVNAAFHSLRVFAICPNKIRKIVFSVVFVLEMIPISVDVFFFTRIADFGASYLPFNGCELSGFSDVGWYYQLAYGSLAAAIAADSVVLMLTYWRTSNIHRALRMQGRKRNLASMVLKDGTVYFAQLTFLNIMSAIGVKLRDGIVVQFAQVLASIVFSRFILDLRNFYLTDSGGDTGYAPSDAALQGSGTFSTVVFSHWRVVGNFGATVEDWLGDSHEEHLNTSSVQNVPQFSEDPFSAGLLQAMEVPEGQVTPPIIA